MNPTNIWRRGPLGRNPYHYTAFRVTRVPREAADRALVVELVGQIRQFVEADPDAHRINGQKVSENDLNQAELILLDPQRRLVEELLEHPAEVPGNDRIEDLIRQVVAHLGTQEGQTLAWTNRQALAAWLKEFCRRYLAQAPAADPTFGAAELDLVPPWGRSGA